MNITVFGTGYVGLVAAACFADKGNKVVCVDVSKEKIEGLKKGVIPIYEPGLGEMVENNKERLEFTTEAKRGVEHAQVIFLAVGTPQKKDSFEADLQYLEAAADTIAQLMHEPKIIVIKSTVPVGTAKDLRQRMKAKTKHAVSIVSNPEFLKEGDAIRDFETPDRVVIGTDDEDAREVMREIYQPFFRRSDRLYEMDNASAELTKYASNIMLANRISVMNELARVAEAMGADITAVRQGVAADSRIGPAFLYPGPGYGGSCFPKDVRELTALSERINVKLDLIPAIDKANEMQKEHFAQKVLHTIKPAKGKIVAVWGASFKPKTDDIRESASLTLIDDLLAAGATVRLYDPEAVQNMQKVYGNRIEYHAKYDCLKGADCLVIMTDWNEFKNPDFPEMRKLMRAPVIVDSRNLYSLQRMTEDGFQYHSIGRRSTSSR